MEVWARGNNVWRQLEFSPSSDEAELPKAGDEEGRNEDGDEEGEPLKYNTCSYAIAGSPTPFLLLSLEEGDLGRHQNALVERHAEALKRNGMGNGWAISGTGMVVDTTGTPTQLPLSLSLTPNTLTFPSPLSLSKDTTQITAGTTHFAALTA
ncbi:hypothetical protein VE04_09880, partial [Pseudogymnoascus sp. 24MN13]